MVVHFSIFCKKGADLSYDAFNAYWSGPHAQLFANLPIVKKKFLKYSQFHFDREASEALWAAGMVVAEFDGAVEFWANSLEDIMAVFTDPEYLGIAVVDENNFMDRDTVRVVIGYDELKHESNTT